MRVRVLFFGMLKDIAGRREDQAEFAAGSQLATVFDHYARQFPRLREMAGSIVLARNQEFSPPATPLSDGDEVAFLPPVSGGSGRYTHQVADPEGHFFALTRLPVDTRQIVAHLLRGEDGAVVTFEGVVRNNTKGRATRYLDYEGYEEMAIKTLARIGRDIAAATPSISRIGMVHRLGRMEIGETSVAVIVTAPHRKPAFDAALEGIDRLKRLAPIWKKEHFADGEVWVEGEWDRNAPVAADR
ncbi:MAG: molybdenum cofactor biosynthesis protein MoaE [Candidatus Solibacter usitatus]|nr:molybdenum cofactor biosynthesis protein MoaE [Candidatus Solibacter usitatus]